jgi:predicted acylesterase/phospholipase RssA
MNIGLCLAGGGAKGSYQAGVIKALFEKGLKITSLSGTSIGAVNGYYIFTGNVDKLEKVWTNIQKTANNNIKIVDKVVDNSPIIDELKALNDEVDSKFDFFVNYVEIKNKNVEERVVNLINLNKSDSINYVKYSSLLPFDPNSKLEFKEQFLQNVVDGVYDNKNLDGGLVRNTLIEPLIEDNVDKIIIISTRHDYNISDDIKKLYDEKNIIVVRPKTEFGPNDTLRFENEFCTKMFNEGYEIGKNLYI